MSKERGVDWGKVVPLKEPPAERPARGPSWLVACECDSNAEPLNNLANALIGLRSDPDLEGLIAYDAMLRTTILTRPAPGQKRDVAFPRSADDIDIGSLQVCLQMKGLRKIGTATVCLAADICAEEHPFHPVREWLAGLEWDGTLRVADWLSTYLRAEKTEYHRQIGTMFLTAMVARITQPGCQADYMLVLEGPQGNLKSSACRALAGQYFSDHLPPLDEDPVRVSLHLRGKWLIEISELSAFNKADSRALKSFLTRTIETYTPKFAHKEVVEPRQCLFIGTTNDDNYLRDETGDRRYWPVKCGEIDLAALIRDRDQLFAEALLIYRRGMKWWPDRTFETEHIKPQQDARYQADAWEEAIIKYLDGITSERVSILQVAESGLLIPRAHIGRSEQLRIAATLRQLGWRQGKRDGGVRWWEPGPRQ